MLPVIFPFVQGLMELMQPLLQLWPMPLLVFQHNKAIEIDFFLQVMLAALESVPSISSCSVCLGGSRGDCSIGPGGGD